MRKVLFIAALVTLTACSSETSTSSSDSTSVDTTNIDSLIDSVDAHTDTLNALLKK